MPDATWMAKVIATCLAISGVGLGMRMLLARYGSGRVAQLHFRRVHGQQVVRLLGGRLDPRRGSPWIDTYLDERPVQLVAAPVEGRLQAGIALLDHRLPMNAWDLSAADGELELLDGVDRAAVGPVLDELRAAHVDSLACGVAIDTPDRPPHIVRMRFDSVDELPDRFTQLGVTLRALEAMHPA